MKRLLDFIGMTVGSWLGWYVGAAVSLFMGIMGSFVGTGVGLYVVRKYTRGLF